MSLRYIPNINMVHQYSYKLISLRLQSNILCQQFCVELFHMIHIDSKG